ncbi:MAG TPA: hypothetical protein VI636_05700 [Candidatus Angelobacter sp.]
MLLWKVVTEGVVAGQVFQAMDGGAGVVAVSVPLPKDAFLR